MAISLNVQPVALIDFLSAVNPLADRSPTSAAAINSAVVADNTSSVVRLSAFGRFLAAAAATETPPVTATAANPTARAVTATVQTGASNADNLAAEQNVSAATRALQNLVNDPGLRAIANNLFNPVYSALMAAAHQADFVTPEPVARANALHADIPGPVMSIARTEAIESYNQAAREFARSQATPIPHELQAE